MNTKISLTESNVGKLFPAVWVGEFNQQPKAGEIRAKQAKVQKLMNDDKWKQVRTALASPHFILVFKWKRISNDPVRYNLKVSLRKDRRFRDGDGNETPPKPRTPPPPPQ